MTIKSELKRLILIYAPPQHQQYYRPFQMDLTADTVRQAVRDTHNGSVLSSSALNSVAGSILRPSDIPIAPVDIQGGFNEGRYSFFIEIETTSIGGRSIETLTGFTSHCGATRKGFLDPTMIFYVNDRLITRQAVSASNLAMGRNVVKDSVSFLTPIDNPAMRVPTSLRPVDIALTGQTSMFARDTNAVTLDTRVLMRDEIHTVNKMSNVPSNYLAQVTGSYINSLRSEDHFGSDLSETTYSQTIGMLQADNIDSSQFVNELDLQDATRYNEFTVRQLQSRWPRDPHFYFVHDPRSNNGQVISHLDVSDHWNGSRVEKTIAYSITHALPAIMSRMQMMSLEFFITNENIGDTITVTLKNGTPMSESFVPTAQFLAGIEQQILIDIVHGIVVPRAPQFKMMIQASLMDSCRFNISVNGGAFIPLSAPLYCNSYYNPMIGGDMDNLHQLRDGVENLVSAIASSSGLFDNGFSAAPGGSMSFESVSHKPPMRTLEEPNPINQPTPMRRV